MAEAPSLADQAYAQLKRMIFDFALMPGDRCSESELAQRLGTPAHMVDAASDLQPAWFEGKQRVGLTAGASAPDILVQQVIERIKALGAVSVRKMQGIEETVKFPLPKGLRIEA